jgi:hypothetical protein
VAYVVWEGEAVAYDVWEGEGVAYDAWEGEAVAYEVWEGEVVAYEVWEGERAYVAGAGKEDTDVLLVRPALARGIGPPLLARIRLVAGPLLPPLVALDAAFFFSVLAFSSSSSCFRRSSSGNSASSLRSSTHLITARSADCSFLFTLLCKINIRHHYWVSDNKEKHNRIQLTGEVIEIRRYGGWIALCNMRKLEVSSYNLTIAIGHTPDWPLLVLELSEAIGDVFLESSR